MSRSRIARKLSLVNAIIDGVEEMHNAHAVLGKFEGHALINWLNSNRNPQLDEIYDLYPSHDPEMTGDQQIGKFFYNLGQINVGEVVSPRQITRPSGRNRPGVCEISTWEISARTKEGLKTAREEFPGPVSSNGATGAPTTPSAADWIRQISGIFEDEPEFEKVIEYGREFRWADRPTDADEE